MHEELGISLRLLGYENKNAELLHFKVSEKAWKKLNTLPHNDKRANIFFLIWREDLFVKI